MQFLTSTYDTSSFLFRTFCIILLCCLFTSFSHAEKTLKAATLIYPPYEYPDSNNQSKGIAVELIQEASERAGYKVEFDFFPWKRAVAMVENGQYDILFNAGVNRARQQWGRYVDSVLILQKYVLFKRRGKQIQIEENFSNTKGYSLGIRAGYLYGSGPFRQALNSGKFRYLQESESTQASVALLLHDRVDMFVGDMLPVMHYIREQGLEQDIDIVLHTDQQPMVVLTWPTYILLSRKTTTEALRTELFKAMESLKADGSFDRIYEKYRNPDKTEY